MNPGLVVKLRPAGPWRIGPDSGARNRVDEIYHSDTLYSAVASAMRQLGMLDEWLAATARAEGPAVCFSSCYPFADEIDFIIPPRTVWPPKAPGMQGRVRWKSARFVPVEVVRSIMAGRRLDHDRWIVDGASQCLVPAGRPGPFRTAVRWSAAVDRLTGNTERHSTACTEFREGAGLWAIVSFADDAARDRWLDLVKAAFRLLADTGFGGERSRGWGRAQTPEFIEGSLPGMILPPPRAKEPRSEKEPRQSWSVAQPVPVEAATEPASEPEAQAAGDNEPLPEPPPDPEPPIQEPDPVPPIEEPPAGDAPVPPAEPPLEASVRAPEQIEELRAPEPAAESESPVENESQAEKELAFESEPPLEKEPRQSGSGSPKGDDVREDAPPLTAQSQTRPYWLLSVFTPAPGDSVDWKRGDYAVVTRGGRIESNARSGDPKKLLRMLAEGSVVFAAEAPKGGAVDVAPEGFPHPVYRAGHAVSIPLPEAR
jgi:CRISPR type III-A-associated RAMP protein Csm4